MASDKPSYLIVGGGVFGASTAYHLIQQQPDASVTLIDRDHFEAPTRVADRSELQADARLEILRTEAGHHADPLLHALGAVESP